MLDTVQKTCSKCRLGKAVTDFSKDKTKLGGYRTDCKNCSNARNKDRYYQNHEENKAYLREYSRNNKDKINEYRRNSPSHKENKKKWYHQRKTTGLCTGCSNTATHGAICDNCFEINKIRKEKLKSLGLCVTHPNEVAYTDGGRCLGCVWKSAELSLKKYNLSIEEYAKMEHAQQRTCAICKEYKDSSLVVDHCHNSGKVRGLLCNTCNVGLGMLNNKFKLNNAATYLGLE